MFFLGSPGRYSERRPPLVNDFRCQYILSERPVFHYIIRPEFFF
jgi:hypothetical protein